MKLIKTICVAGASCLMMASCGSKEAELYNQIKTFPSSDLIAQYEAECPDGEHLDSVKTYYAAVVNEIRELGDTTDFQAYLNFSDSIAIDSVKSWALIKADTLLLDSINRNGTVALCETYIKYFPKSKNLSVIEAKKKELQEKYQKEIDNLLSSYANNLNKRRKAKASCDYYAGYEQFGANMGLRMDMLDRMEAYDAGNRYQRAKNACAKDLNKLKQYKAYMNSEQLSKFEKLSVMPQ